MTPEELDKLEALVKAATPGDWYVDSSRRGIETQAEIGAVEVIAWAAHVDVAMISAMKNAAPALIAAAREAARLRATVDAQTAIIVDLKVEKAGLDVKVERLRTFAPVWSNVDDGYGLYVGTAWIGLIDSRGYGWARIGPYPEICYQPGTLPHSVAEAARAVCSRLGIPDVGVEGV